MTTETTTAAAAAEAAPAQETPTLEQQVTAMGMQILEVVNRSDDVNVGLLALLSVALGIVHVNPDVAPEYAELTAKTAGEMARLGAVHRAALASAH